MTDRVGASLAGHAASTADRPALLTPRGGLSWGRLERRVAARARGLRARTGPGEAVALLLDSGPELLTWVLAACRAGRVAMVLDSAWPEGRVATVLERVVPGAVIAGAGPVGPRRDHGQPLALAAATDAEPFYVGFTSGTTGTPKAYLRSHGSWLASFAAWSAVVPTGPDDRVLVPGGLHSSLFLFAGLHALHTGATVHLLEGWDADDAARVLARRAVTCVQVVPAMLVQLLRRWEQDARAHAGAAASLRTIVSGGAPLPAAARRRLAGMLPGVRPVEYYGASELSFVGWREARPDCSSFTVLPPVEVELRSGTIHARSPLLFAGYVPGGGQPLDDPRDDAGFVTVGDRGRWCDDGTLALLGRPEEVLHCGGQTVDAATVEAVLRGAPGVSDAMVVATDHPRLGQLPAALLVGADAVPARAALRRHVAQRLPREHRPRRFYAVDGLPAGHDRAGARPEYGRRLQAGTLGAVALA